MTKSYNKTIKMSHDNLESAVVSFLMATSVLNDDENVIMSDFGLEVDADGMIEFDLEIVADKPRLSIVK